MQEPGPVSPIDEGLDQRPFQGEAPTNDTPSEPSDVEAAPKEAAKRPRRPKRTSDPVVTGLKWGIAAIVVIWMVGMLSAMIFGLLTPPTAPRTAAERDLMSLTATVESGQANTQTYSQYVSTLITAGQLAKAQQALNEALKIAKKDRSFLYARQADLALARKDYKGAVTAADKAMAEADKEVKALVDTNKKNNRNPLAGVVIPESYTDAALAKAEALLASKQYAGAVKAFDLYLKHSPTDADILVQRAQAKVETGDKKGAAKDFRAALKFIPDYQPALDGLKQIGEAK